MSAQLMGLVRELKALNARKKAGEELTPDEEERRKELKTFLKAQLEGSGAEDPGAGQSRQPTAASTPPMAPQPMTPAPVPQARPAAPPPPPPRETPRPVSTVQQAAPPQAPMPGSSPKVAPKKDAYMIAGVDSLFEQASKSEAVNKTAMTTKGRPIAQASEAEIADAEAAADAAIRATKKRERATTPEDVEAQLREIGGTYTPPSHDFVLEQYYGDYFGEGMQTAEVSSSMNLAPIDPRELQFRQALDVAFGNGAGATTVTVPPGLAFLDDFGQLYARRVLAAPADTSAGADDPALLIGRRKVTIHLLNGEKKQGLVRSLRRGEMGMKVEVAGGAMEDVPLTTVKAVFVHLNTNAAPPTIQGKTITVLFRDQRTVQGDSNDYDPNAPVFSLVPPAGRGQFEKIVINMLAVASVG